MSKCKKSIFSFAFVNITSFESESVNHIGGDDAHRDADVEGDGAEEVDVRVDVLVEVVRTDGSDRGIADPEGIVGEVEQGDREENHPTDSVNFIPDQENLEDKLGADDIEAFERKSKNLNFG